MRMTDAELTICTLSCSRTDPPANTSQAVRVEEGVASRRGGIYSCLQGAQRRNHTAANVKQLHQYERLLASGMVFRHCGEAVLRKRTRLNVPNHLARKLDSQRHTS